MPTRLYSIGHGAKPGTQLLAELQEAHIETLVDVRSLPRSRFHPQYNQKALEASLREAGIAYEWKGESLGGRGTNVGYDEAVTGLIERAGTERIALMCSERDYLDCHRHTMLEPSFLAKGVHLVHLPAAQASLL